MMEIIKTTEQKVLVSGQMKLEVKELEVLFSREQKINHEDPWLVFHIDEILRTFDRSEVDTLSDVLLLHFGWRPGVSYFRGQSPKLIVDVDETIFNSVEQHWRYLTQLLPAFFQWDKERMPSYDAVCLANGTHGAYKAAMPHPGSYDDYLFLNQCMRFNVAFNSGQKMIEGAKEALEALAPQVLLYFTTRPESIAELTRRELIEHGFPDREVIARPDVVPFDKTSMWKILHLACLSHLHKCPVTMVDDSITTHRMIEALRMPHIQSLLVKGPMTPKSHVDAMDWDQIVHLFLDAMK